MSMATDGRLGKREVRDWPGLLQRLCPPDFWQRWLGTLDQRATAAARWTPKYLVLAWIFIGWEQAETLGARFAVARGVLVTLFPTRRRPGRALGGFTTCSKKFGSAPLRDFWRQLRTTAPRRLGNAWQWQGRLVFAVDGSRVDAPRTHPNEKKLGCAGRAKTGPQWWVTALVHLPSQMLWDWQIGPGTNCERDDLVTLIPQLPRGALLVADAAYVSYDLLKTLRENEIDFLIRCGGNCTLRVDGAATLEDLGSSAHVLLWPDRSSARLPLGLRLITLKQGGQRMYLLTNIFARTALSKAQARKLYAARWGIEVHFRALKQTLGRRKLLARTPEMGATELTGNLLALALLRLQAALLLGAQVDRASVARWLAVLRRALAALHHQRTTRWFFKEARQALLDDYQRKRSKRARDWPHKKRDQPPQPPNLHNLTTRQRNKLDRLMTIPNY